MRRFTLLALGVLLASLAVVSPRAATQASMRWVIRDLGTFRGKASDAIAINARGEIIGTYDAPDRWHRHGFVWRNGVERDLGRCKGDFNRTEPVAINDHGLIIGNCQRVGLDREGEYVRTSRAFLWQNGRMTELRTFGGKRTYATAINSRGQVAGWGETKVTDTDGQLISHAFLWQGGRMIDLGGRNSSAVAINERGLVAGAIDQGQSEPRAVLWAKGQMALLPLAPRGDQSWAYAMNNHGQIVGWASGKHVRAALWENGKLRLLGGPGELSSARAINERSQIFGESGVLGSFLWYRGQVSHLNIFTDQTFALNDRGQLVGNKSAGVVLINTAGSDTQDSTLLTPLPGAQKDQYGRFAYGVVAINERNEIVGWSAAKNGHHHAVLWTLKRG